jgi:hypothetical protein
MGRSLCCIMASIALVFICSCVTRKPHTTGARMHPTGISAEEGVVILLITSGSNEKSIESEGEEKSLGNCVRNGMMKADSKIVSVSAREFRHTIFPNKGFLDSPRYPEDLLAFLSEPEAQSRVMGLGIRYLLLLTAFTSRSEKDSKFHSSGIDVSFGEYWTEQSNITAVVLDVKYLRQSGSVSVGCEGGGGWMASCSVPVFPCFIPFGFCNFPRTEAEACSALGEEVMKFLIDGHDMVPTPELGAGSESGGRGSDIQSDIQAEPQPGPGSEEDLLKRTQEPGRYEEESQN